MNRVLDKSETQSPLHWGFPIPFRRGRTFWRQRFQCLAGGILVPLASMPRLQGYDREDSCDTVAPLEPLPK